MVIWGDLTWHDSVLRSNIGERLMILGTYSLPFMFDREPAGNMVSLFQMERSS